MLGCSGGIFDNRALSFTFVLPIILSHVRRCKTELGSSSLAMSSSFAVRAQSRCVGRDFPLQEMEAECDGRRRQPQSWTQVFGSRCAELRHIASFSCLSSVRAQMLIYVPTRQACHRCLVPCESSRKKVNRRCCLPRLFFVSRLPS